MMVEGGGQVDPSSISTAPEPDMTQDPRVQKTFGRTGFFCPFATFGVDMAPGAAAGAAAAMEQKERPVLLYLPGTTCLPCLAYASGRHQQNCGTPPPSLNL